MGYQAGSSRCVLCGGSDYEPLVMAYDRMQPRAEDYLYCRCASCELVALQPPPRPHEILDLYPAAYSPHVGHSEQQRDKLINRLAVKYFYGVDSKRRSRLLRSVFRLLSGRIMKGTREPYGGNRLLDIGCGSGGLLLRYQSLGWSVFGIEMSQRAWALCREKRLEVHRGTIFDAPLAGRQFDLIFMNHVIEHVLDPVGVLARSAELLAPGGRVIVATPNIRGIGFSLYGSCWYPLDAPRHLVLFSPRTMRLLGDKSGLVTRRVVTQSVPRMLCESRHYARTQGRLLPAGLERRAELLAASVRSKQPYKAYRKLVAPFAALCAKLGRGDIMEAEFGLRHP